MRRKVGIAHVRLVTPASRKLTAEWGQCVGDGSENQPDGTQRTDAERHHDEQRDPVGEVDAGCKQYESQATAISVKPGGSATASIPIAGQ